MEIKYKTDLYTSYMLVEIPEYVDRSQYSFKMLEKNKMQFILSGKERMEDGKGYLYIDIGGKKNLIQEYMEKELQLEDMVAIFQQLLPALEELRNYLLTENMALLEPEFIYKDMEDGHLCIALLPWEQESRGLRKLAEFFLEKMDHKDENGVNAAYHFYRQQGQPQFSLYHFIPVLEKEMILKRQKKQEKEDLKQIAPKKEKRECSEEVINDKSEVLRSLSEIESKQEKSSKGSNKAWLICMILSIGICLCTFLPFVEKNQKLSFLAASVLLFLVSVIVKLYQSFFQNKSIKKELKEETLDDNTEFFQENLIEETVFFDSCDEEDLLKLQWKEKGRKKQFTLQNFPCTVGKIKEEVSVVIQDASVSRVHCRFVEKDRGIAVMDLNSTNGTYLNGMKLKEGEILEIVKNDEILIGKVRVLVV